MNSKTFSMAVLAGSLLVANSAFSEEILVLNNNFESDIVPHDPGYTSFISGWVNTGYGSIGVDLPKAGEDYSDVNNHGQVAYITEGGRISQTVATTLLADETYTLDYEIGRPLGQTGHHFIARFKANGLVVAQTQSDANSVAEGDWATQSLSFTATKDMPVGYPLVVEFHNLSSDIGHNVHIDNISLDIAGTGVETPTEEEQVVTISSVMIGDTTLNVPEDFPNINAALASINDKVIKKDSIVTIQVNNCAANDSNSTVLVTHPQGQNIHIIGNPQDPGACVLQFVGVDGFHVTNNANLGYLDGFHIKGTEVGGTEGIRASNGGKISVGPNVWVSDFNFGFSAFYRGKIFANHTVSFSHTDSGYVSQYGGYLQAQHAESYGNAQEGFEAWAGGLLLASHSHAYGNAGRGVIAHDASYVNTDYGISSGNQLQGFGSHGFSALSNYSSQSKNNRRHRNDVGNHSFMDRRNQTASGNSNRYTEMYFGSYHR